MQRSKSKRQKAWQYMRRNPMFATNDILIILEMSEKSLMLLVRQLISNNYLKQISGGKVFRERNYKLIKNTGVICPKWIEKQKRLFDENIQVLGLKEPNYKPKEAKKIEHRPVDPIEYAKGRIRQILACEPEGIDILRLSQRSGVHGGQFSRTITKLVEDGEVKKIEVAGGMPIFKLRGGVE